MSEFLIVFALIMFSCVFANAFSGKSGMPALLLFMGLGMLCGSDGLFKIPFDNYEILQQISTIALIVIIFYGGFPQIIIGLIHHIHPNPLNWDHCLDLQARDLFHRQVNST